ncbi:MAG: RtcB family protein, partial [Candidatus Magasanikbacteria bacterium]
EEASFAMPDAHQGYGMPVGGVAAFSLDEGIISPGAVGYDINCGVRLIKTGESFQNFRKRKSEFADNLDEYVPSGVGQGGHINLSRNDLNSLMESGVDWMLENGYGIQEDKILCESRGKLLEADKSFVSQRAKKRGSDQVGTLGSGNHFLEVQRVETIFDKRSAEAMNIRENEVVVMIHCGSRGFGHQIATDYIDQFLESLDKYNLNLVDDQLACAPFQSKEGRQYWKAMAAAANFAWANRQFITHLVRKAWSETFGEKMSSVRGELSLVYDVAHNLAKVENHKVGSGFKEVIVHRKGATRAFPSGHSETPEVYEEVGQPVMIPGSMSTPSFVLVGREDSMRKSFGSSCHGAGRVMSRTKAKKKVWGEDLRDKLEDRGIDIRADSMPGLAEEASIAYKDPSEVVRVVENLNLASRVAKMKPLSVIKG